MPQSGTAVTAVATAATAAIAAVSTATAAPAVTDRSCSPLRPWLRARFYTSRVCCQPGARRVGACSSRVPRAFASDALRVAYVRSRLALEQPPRQINGATCEAKSSLEPAMSRRKKSRVDRGPTRACEYLQSGVSANDANRKPYYCRRLLSASGGA